MFGSFLPSALGWLVATKVYSATGADIVMESITLIDLAVIQTTAGQSVGSWVPIWRSSTGKPRTPWRAGARFFPVIAAAGFFQFQLVPTCAELAFQHASPTRRACAIPATTRVRSISRSNSATAPRTRKVRRPAGNVVSMFFPVKFSPLSVLCTPLKWSAMSPRSSQPVPPDRRIG